MNKQNGFTLIELMMTMAVIGVLSSLSYWFYKIYVIKAQIIEGLSLSQQAQRLVNDYKDSTGEWPANSSDLYLNSINGKYVTSVEVSSGSTPSVIVVTFGNQANLEIAGKTVLMTATPHLEGNVSWVCSRGTIDALFLPGVCRS